jgi:hypothetical protein
VKELDGADVLVGSCNGFRVAAVFDEGPVWSKAADDLSGAALWIPDIEFQVDWDTFSVFDQIDSKLGALGIQSGKIFIAAAPPSKVGYVPVQVGEAQVTEGGIAYGFTRWCAVTRRDDETFTLLERGAA